jgi:hypothetical protein
MLPISEIFQANNRTKKKTFAKEVKARGKNPAKDRMCE